MGRPGSKEKEAFLENGREDGLLTLGIEDQGDKEPDNDRRHHPDTGIFQYPAEDTPKAPCLDF